MTTTAITVDQVTDIAVGRMNKLFDSIELDNMGLDDLLAIMTTYSKAMARIIAAVNQDARVLSFPEASDGS